MQCFRRWVPYQSAKCLQRADVLQSARSPQRARAKVLAHSQGRNFGLDSIPTILQPPIIFSGLLVTLWTYKCLMMVIFQNKIIYMPSVPPFSRSEKVSDYATQCAPVTWSEHDIKSADGTALKILESGLSTTQNPRRQQHVAVLYLQG